jgi:hypothetical protein
MAKKDSTPALTLIVAGEDDVQITREVKPGESVQHGFIRRKVAAKTEVKLDDVRVQLNAIQGQLDSLLESLTDPKAGPFRLSEVEVGLSITAEGSIGIATVGGEVSLTLKFGRKE